MHRYLNIPTHGTMRLEVDIPSSIYIALAEVAYAENRTLDDVYTDAAIVALRSRGRGDGFPEPRPPTALPNDESPEARLDEPQDELDADDRQGPTP